MYNNTTTRNKKNNAVSQKYRLFTLILLGALMVLFTSNTYAQRSGQPRNNSMLIVQENVQIIDVSPSDQTTPSDDEVVITGYVFIDSDGVASIFNPANGDIPLGGISVTLRNNATGSELNVTTDLTGEYWFVMPPGSYTLSVDVTGLPYVYGNLYDSDGGSDNEAIVEALPSDFIIAEQDFSYFKVVRSVDTSTLPVTHDLGSTTHETADALTYWHTGYYPVDCVTLLESPTPLCIR